MQHLPCFPKTAVLGLAVWAVALCGPAPSALADTIAYWRFEPGNLTYDWSGNGHSLTNVGVIESSDVSPIAPGSASTYFDGTHTTFSTASNLNLSAYSQLTIEWFMKSSQTTDGLLLEHSPDQNVNFGALMVPLNPGYGVPGGVGMTNRASIGHYRDYTPALSDGWHHVAVWIDNTVNNNTGDRIKIFVDRVHVSTNNDNENPTALTPFRNDVLYVGSRNNSQYKYVGYLDELRISSGLLDPSRFIPEPSSAMLLCLGVFGLGLRGRRRRT